MASSAAAAAHRKNRANVSMTLSGAMTRHSLPASTAGDATSSVAGDVPSSRRHQSSARARPVAGAAVATPPEEGLRGVGAGAAAAALARGVKPPGRLARGLQPAALTSRGRRRGSAARAEGGRRAGRIVGCLRRVRPTSARAWLCRRMCVFVGLTCRRVWWRVCDPGEGEGVWRNAEKEDTRVGVGVFNLFLSSFAQNHSSTHPPFCPHSAQQQLGPPVRVFPCLSPKVTTSKKIQAKKHTSLSLSSLNPLSPTPPAAASRSPP